jgi:hypothetical protein
MRPSTPLLSLLAAGCVAPTPKLGATPAAEVDHSAQTSYALYGGFGDAPVRAEILALNDVGAAVPAPDLEVDVDGTSVLAHFDASGYATVRYDDPGHHTLGAGDLAADVDVFDGLWPGLPLLEASIAPVAGAIDARPVSSGAVVRTANELWWAPRGGAPIRVLSSPDPLLGLKTGDIDVDGTTDALTWTRTELYVLEGRPDGGMSWGTAFSAPGYTIAGAEIGDATGDNLSDIAIAWVGGEAGGLLDVWEGDGQWHFAAAYPRVLVDVPSGVTIGDNDHSGENQISVATETGTFARYSWLEHVLLPIGPLLPAGTIGLGTTVDNTGDATGNIGDELLFQLPSESGGSESMTLFDLIGFEPSFVPIRWNWNPVGAHWAWSDPDRDGYSDLVAQEESRALGIYTYSSLGSNFTQRLVGTLQEQGPIALGDWNADGFDDLFLAGGSTWWVYDGTDQVKGNVDLPWGIREPDFERASARAAGTVATWSPPGQTPRFVTFEYPSDGTTRVRSVQWNGADAELPLEELSNLSISTTGAKVVDSALCDTGMIALLDDGTLDLFALDRTDGTLTLAAKVSTPTALGVGCGKGPGLAHYVLANGTEVDALGDKLGVLLNVPTPGAEDAAFGDFGGGAVAQGCVQPGCAITWVSAGVGKGAFLTVTPSGAIVTTEDGDHALPGSGDHVFAQDLDGDGIEEGISSSADGRLEIYRWTGQGLAGPLVYHHGELTEGLPTWADSDGDGIADLWVVNTLHELRYMTSAPPPTTTPSTTGTDTGN